VKPGGRPLTGYLDIESLVFLAEKFADALLRADDAQGASEAEG